MTEPFDVEITRWVEPGTHQLGEWAAVAPSTLDLIDAVLSDDGTVEVRFTHEGKRYRGRAIVTDTGGKYATLLGTGSPIEERG